MSYTYNVILLFGDSDFVSDVDDHLFILPTFPNYPHTTELLKDMKKLASPMDKLKILKHVLDSYALMSNFKKQLVAAQDAAGLNTLSLPNFCTCPPNKTASFFEGQEQQHDVVLRSWESWAGSGRYRKDRPKSTQNFFPHSFSPRPISCCLLVCE